MPAKMILLTLTCVLGIAIGQIMFKKAAINLPDNAVAMDWVTNIWLLAALVLYGVTTLLWIWVLKHSPLHIAYPFMALAFILVPLMSYFILNEPVEARTFIGAALIAVGVSLTSTT